jgi:thiol:disulfide interchange protein DsbG
MANLSNFLRIIVIGSVVGSVVGFLSACREPQGLNSAKTQDKKPTTPVAASVAETLTGEQKGELLIQNLTHHYVQVTSHFDAPGGLIGYVIQPVGKKRGNIIYTDAAGEYLFSGNIVNAAGENITQQETDTYINSKLVGQMYQEMSQLNFFTQGKDEAPHKIYIMFDPNCSICHMVFSMVQPMIDSGDLQVRWVPVGIMQMSSVGKAAAIMMGENDQARIDLLKQDENNFDMKTESGGVPELKPVQAQPLDAKPVNPGKGMTPAANPVNSNSASAQDSANAEAKNKKISQAFDLIAKNNQYFSDYGFNGTPVFLMKYATGEVKFFPGFYQGSWLADEVKKAGDSWV